jgi:beta-galactosidase
VGIPDDPAQTDSLFRKLADHHMPVARIWITLDPFHPENWDFTKYDQAFEAAEKYGVGICPTLGPAGSGVCVMPEKKENLPEARHYIKTIVNRYKDHPALDTWMLLNEPGRPPQHNPLAMQRFREWLKDKYGSTNNMWGNYESFQEVQFDDSWEESPSRAFVDWHTFWRSHMAWYLDWIAEEVRKWDQTTPLHGNPHSLIGNIAYLSLDLPSWRPFLNSLGGSMHPSWHFGELLDRDQYALGAAYECDLLRGSFEPKSFWITELQGGNNLYRPSYPMNPTDKDIAQFLWTNIGSGAKRIIYWELNPSSQWSLLDFQGRPSERIITSSQVAQTMNRHEKFFREAKQVETPVSVILSLESMTLQLATEGWNIDAEKDHTGRKQEAHVLAAMGYYKTLQDMGIPVNIKHIHDYDWEEESGDPRLAIIPHATAITEGQARAIERFVKNGNTILVSGLTGIYDPYRDFLPTQEFPLKNALGARLKEIRFIEPYYQTQLTRPDVSLPTHLWTGIIDKLNSTALGTREEHVIATRNQYGEGKSIWIPSMVGIGAWKKDNQPLADFLKYHFHDFLKEAPFSFSRKYEHCVLRTMKSNERYLTVVTNGSKQPKRCVLNVKKEELEPSLIWGKNKQVKMNGREIHLGPRETLVLLWK